MVIVLKIYAISDLHLSFQTPVDPQRWDLVTVVKPMDIFHDLWREHYRQIYENWLNLVRPEDLVLLPGDLSWAMKLPDARFDLEFLGLLPGRLVAIAGNHDYWWQSLSRVRQALPANLRVLQNDCLDFAGIAVCGSRGWNCPGGAWFKDEDQKIYNRELIRMENSLKQAAGARRVLAMTHFMPTNERHEKNEMIELFQQYQVSDVIYGHLHAASANQKLPEQLWGINFHLVSADYLRFKPRLIYSQE